MKHFVLFFILIFYLKAHSVIGEDDRIYVRGTKWSKILSGVVEINNSCTGFVMENDLIVTAAHCLGYVKISEDFSEKPLFDQEGNPYQENIEKIEVRYGDAYFDFESKKEIFDESSKIYYVKEIYSGFKYHADNDFALIRLKKPLPKKIKRFKLFHESLLKDYKIIRYKGGNVSTAGYHGDNDKTLNQRLLHLGCKIKSSKRGVDDLRFWPELGDFFWLHKLDCDTSMGSSGSPVFYVLEHKKTKKIELAAIGIIYTSTTEFVRYFSMKLGGFVLSNGLAYSDSSCLESYGEFVSITNNASFLHHFKTNENYSPRVNPFIFEQDKKHIYRKHRTLVMHHQLSDCKKRVKKLSLKEIKRRFNERKKNPILEKGSDPLFLAAAKGDIKKIKFLKKRGRDLNKKIQGINILALAVYNGHYQLINFLLQNGFDINEENEQGYTVLHAVAKSGNIKMLKFLIKKGLKLKDKAQVPAIHLASELGHLKMVKFLIKHSFNPHKKDDLYGYTALHWAVVSGNLDLVKFLIKEGLDINAKDKDGLTALMEAFRLNNLDVMRLLIKHGANVNVKDEYGRVLLNLIIYYLKNINLARLLIKHGADVNAKGEYGQTPLHEAVLAEDLDLASILIKHGADVNAKDDKYGQTPLHIAIHLEQFDLSQFCIKHGADVNVKDKREETPLHYAARSEDLDLASILIKHGADVNAKDDKYGQTPLHIAFFYHMREGLQNIDAIELLIKKGAYVNIKDNRKKTPLHHAARLNNTNLARLLIKHGADVNAKDYMEDAPIHLAINAHIKNVHQNINSSSTSLIELLAKNGADLNTKDSHEEIPLYYAIALKDINLVKLMVKHGADVNAKDGDGNTLLNLSKYYSVKIYEYLKEQMNQ